MLTSKQIRQQLLKKMPSSTMYNRLKLIRKKTGNSVSHSVALDVLGSLNGINIYKLLNKEGRTEEIAQFQNVMSKFDFNERIPIKRTQSNLHNSIKIERSPYDLPLGKFNLDSELVRDCRMKAPYRIPVKEAMLTLETRIRDKLGLGDDVIGVHLVDEARKKGLFESLVKAEEEGLYMLFRGGMLYFRNPPGHRKIIYTKENALKIVIFADYLIQLFTQLHDTWKSHKS